MPKKGTTFRLRSREISPLLTGIFFLIGLLLLEHTAVGAEIEEGIVRLGTAPGLRDRILQPLASTFSFGGGRALEEENAGLSRENRLLLERMSELEMLRRENQALRQIVNSPLFYEVPTAVKIARILGNSPSKPKEILYIDLGKNGEVSKDDLAALPVKTLVGKVREVFDESAVVETVFNPEMKIAVRVGDVWAEGLFLGGGKAKVSFIAKDAAVNVGDAVVTSGKDGNVPAGFLVGKVKEVISRPAEPFKEVLVEIPEELFGEATIAVIKNPLR